MSTSIKLLLLEDQEWDAELVLLQLKRSGFKIEWQRVETARDFASCLDPSLDLILADYSLPQFDALQALKLLRESGLDIPFIIVSGAIGEDVAVSAMKQGAADYLLKDRLARLGQAVTQALEQNERLQALSRRLVEVQEAERRYLARELHDEIGQYLTCLRFMLEIRLPPGEEDGASNQPSEEVYTRLAKAQELVAELVARVRQLSLDLRPAMLDDLGILPALLWLFERYTSQTGVRVSFRHQGLEDRRFLQEIETAVYRIVQEALTNVARHAGVKRVGVQVWARENELSLQVNDQGAGFHPETALAARSSTGLPGMCERANLLGGQLKIESAPDAGARIIAAFPV